MSNTTLFTLPDRKRAEYDQYIEIYSAIHWTPKIGVVIPVSGERTQIYNQQVGVVHYEVKHLEFCAFGPSPSEWHYQNNCNRT